MVTLIMEILHYSDLLLSKSNQKLDTLIAATAIHVITMVHQSCRRNKSIEKMIVLCQQELQTHLRVTFKQKKKYKQKNKGHAIISF